MAALVVIACVSEFGHVGLWPLSFPVVGWAALRFKRLGAVWSACLVTLLVSVGLAIGVDSVLLTARYGLLQAVVFVFAVWATTQGVVIAQGMHVAQLSRTREELELAHSLLRVCPPALSAVDLEGRVTLWNNAAEALLGWSTQDVLGKEPVILPAGKEDEFGEVRAATQRGEPVSGLETVRRRRDGTLIPVRLTSVPIRAEAGRVLGSLAVFEDLRDLKKVRSELKRTLEVLGALPDLIAVAEPTGRLVYLNPAGRELLGYARNEALKTVSIPDIVFKTTLGKVFEEAIPALDQKGEWVGEVDLRHRDGHAIPVSQVALGHRSEEGAIQYYSCVAHDLRGRKELTRQLLDAEAKLRQAQRMEVVGMLVGGIAHDFNNLITVMLGASDLALSKLPPEHAARKEILDLQHVSERAAVLANQLLAYGRKKVASAERVDVNKVVLGLEAILRRVLGDRNQLLYALGEQVGNVNVDEGQLEQVVMNLVVNARDAMPSGGTLTIETGEIELSPEVAGGDGDSAIDTKVADAWSDEGSGAYVRLTVRDTGSGMGMHTQTHLFEPFFTTKELGKGTGIGLSTVHGIVENAGGFLSVQSSKGKGAAFHVYLPRAEEVTAAALLEDAAVSSEKEFSGDETVLVVEDEEVVRELIERVLVGRGYHVLTMADGESVASLSDEARGAVQLALVDVALPGRSGLRLVRELRRIVPDLPVLVMAGHLEPGAEGTAPFDAHATLLAKPFSPEVLARRVRDALDAAQRETL